MKPKTMMLMVVAVGCGLAASYMTSRLLAERSNAQVEEPKVKCLVAKAKVPAWALIKEPEKYFEEKEFPESAVPKKALRELKDIKDQRLSATLAEGEFVLSEKLVNAEQVGLIAKLPAGMRAIALKVNAESLAGGFVLPGYRVDVVSTLRGGAAESVSRIILQNMLVLAVDTNATRDNQTTSMLGNTVTLAATPEEAQRLTLAAAMGELRLTLRTPDDTKIVRLPAVKWDDLKKPVRDPSGVVADEEPTPPTVAPPVPPLPALPTPPKEVVPPPTVVEKPVVKKPEPPPAKTHTLVIQNGEYRESGKFTFDPVEKVWNGGGLGQRADDAMRRRPAPAPSAPSPPPSELPDPVNPNPGPGYFQ